MEDAVDEIMAQLGVVQQGRISFHDFVRCRMQLIAEIEQEKLREHRLAELSHHDQTGLVLQDEAGVGEWCFHMFDEWDIGFSLSGYGVIW